MKIKILSIFLLKLKIVATNLSIAVWGDDTFQDCNEYSESGSEITLKHTWKEQGLFTIRLKAKEPYNAESYLSKLEIETPRLGKQNTHSFLFMFLERIQNIFNIKYIINNIRGI